MVTVLFYSFGFPVDSAWLFAFTVVAFTFTGFAVDQFVVCYVRYVRSYVGFSAAGLRWFGCCHVWLVRVVAVGYVLRTLRDCSSFGCYYGLRSSGSLVWFWLPVLYCSARVCLRFRSLLVCGSVRLIVPLRFCDVTFGCRLRLLLFVTVAGFRCYVLLPVGYVYVRCIGYRYVRCLPFGSVRSFGLPVTAHTFCGWFVPFVTVGLRFG
jgi:hypothetical protein